MKRIQRILFVMLIFWGTSGCDSRVEPTAKMGVMPAVIPDYAGVTIPSGIAPLNFRVDGEYERIQVVFGPAEGEPWHVTGKQSVDIPLRKWHEMLDRNRGKSIRVTTAVKQNKTWSEYDPFERYVSGDSIDHGLAYRLIAPGYEVYSKMGIYQRNLSNFDQTAIYENTLVAGSCVNCHSFKMNDPATMSMHLRGTKGGTMLLSDDEMEWLSTKTEKTMSNFVYPFWHPSGNFVAYSVNNTHQVFHSSNVKRVEVFDAKSDVVVYDISKKQAILSERLMQDSIFETFPTFSPDGLTLYFCAAVAKTMPAEFEEVHYDLCRIGFDPKTGTFGDKIDTVFNASSNGQSVTFPRPSPDGRYIMFTMADYGNFSIWHKEADLYLLDLQTGLTRALDEVNSTGTESYHSWSSNSRWFVFSSRRDDGLYTRPYIAHLDESGKAGKPFLLPQKKIDFYDELIYSFNIPEFLSGPVKLDIPALEEKMSSSPDTVSFRQTY